MIFNTFTRPETDNLVVLNYSHLYSSFARNAVVTDATSLDLFCLYKKMSPAVSRTLHICPVMDKIPERESLQTSNGKL